MEDQCLVPGCSAPWFGSRFICAPSRAVQGLASRERLERRRIGGSLRAIGDLVAVYTHSVCSVRPKLELLQCQLIFDNATEVGHAMLFLLLLVYCS
jgi:hypothetical protein